MFPSNCTVLRLDLFNLNIYPIFFYYLFLFNSFVVGEYISKQFIKFSTYVLLWRKCHFHLRRMHVLPLLWNMFCRFVLYNLLCFICCLFPSCNTWASTIKIENYHWILFVFCLSVLSVCILVFCYSAVMLLYNFLLPNHPMSLWIFLFVLVFVCHELGTIIFNIHIFIVTVHVAFLILLLSNYLTNSDTHSW